MCLPSASQHTCQNGPSCLVAWEWEYHNSFAQPPIPISTKMINIVWAILPHPHPLHIPPTPMQLFNVAHKCKELGIISNDKATTGQYSDCAVITCSGVMVTIWCAADHASTLGLKWAAIDLTLTKLPASWAAMLACSLPLCAYLRAMQY